MKAQIHRFGGKVAVYVGNGDTVYLDPNTAQQLAQALDDCATDCFNFSKFQDSQFQTVEIELGKGSNQP